MDSELIVKRKAKDSVFTHLFRDKRYIVQLYQALHPEAAPVTQDMIEIVTLENVVTDNLYNDLGFIAGGQIVVLAEAQSTWTFNILVRAFLYLSQTYLDLIHREELNLYGSRKIALPRPELYVIYTGNRKIDKRVISLSEEFFGGMQTDLEVRVHVLTGEDKDDIIGQYVAFTKVLDERVRLRGRTREAIEETILICKDRNVLRQYLTEHEKEVQNIMITLFDHEQIMKAFEHDKFEEGRAEGEARGLAKGEARGLAKGEKKNAIETAKKMLQKAMSIDLIVELCGLSRSEVEALKAQLSL